jgi:hypothetical protein
MRTSEYNPRILSSRLPEQDERNIYFRVQLETRSIPMSAMKVNFKPSFLLHFMQEITTPFQSDNRLLIKLLRHYVNMIQTRAVY